MFKLEYATMCQALARNALEREETEPKKCCAGMITYYQNMYTSIKYAVQYLLDKEGISYTSSTDIKGLIESIPSKYADRRWCMYLYNCRSDIMLWWDAYANQKSIDFSSGKHLGAWQTVGKMLKEIE